MWLTLIGTGGIVKVLIVQVSFLVPMILCMQLEKVKSHHNINALCILSHFVQVCACITKMIIEERESFFDLQSEQSLEPLEIAFLICPSFCNLVENHDPIGYNSVPPTVILETIKHDHISSIAY